MTRASGLTIIYFIGWNSLCISSIVLFLCIYSYINDKSAVYSKNSLSMEIKRVLESNLAPNVSYQELSSYIDQQNRNKHPINIKDNFGKNFSNLDLTGAKIQNADMRGIHFSDTILDMGDFSESDMNSANFNNVTARGMSLSKAIFVRTTFVNSNLSLSDFSNSHLADSKIVNSNFQGVDFSGADLSGITMINVDLSRSNLSKTKLDRTVFKNVKLHNVNIEETSMYNITIDSSTIHNSNFNNISMIDGTLINNIIRKTTFSDSDLRGIISKGNNTDEVDFLTSKLYNKVLN